MPVGPFPASRVWLLAAALSAPPAHADPPGPPEDSGGSTRPSNLLNPAISVNALLLGAWRQSEGSEDPLAGPPTGVSLSEAELIFSATVDPYLKADVIAALSDRRGEGEGHAADIEEAYVTALRLPRGLGLRAGKMLLPFGRHNLLHAHAFPFIQAPLAAEAVFGEEGLNEPGIELSWLLPSRWYSQLSVDVVDGRNHELFAGSRPEALAYLAHWKNLWDLGESATFEAGGSFLYGKSDEALDAASRVSGLNLTYKYRPARRSVYRALEAQVELLRRDRDADALDGGYAHLRWQAARRWWLQGRYDWVDRQGSARIEHRESALVAFAPSEFSAIRLEYASRRPETGERDHQVLVQLNYSIGPHPAHVY